MLRSSKLSACISGCGPMALRAVFTPTNSATPALPAACTSRDGVANPTIITAVVDLEPSRKADTGCCARTCLRCGENFLGKLKVIDRQVTLHRQGQCRARLSWLCPIPECKKRPSGFQFEAALVAVSHSAGISCLLVPYSCLPTPAFHGCS